ncbi:MAG: serine/threonine protein phosphatase [Gemmataceae bacterium]|nr:serine/threonine protein phosphatase [Gemmataceae bacterium]
MRVLAIGDVHGCLYQLDDLLDWVKPTAEDLVITLGDYVDRGPDSRGVLDRLVGLKKQGPKLICLRGNHEIMMLAARAGTRADRSMWLSVGGVQTLGSYGPAPGKSGALADVPEEHWAFLDYNLLDYYETDQHIFVHAGVACGIDMAEQPEHALYWDFLGEAMRHHSGKTVVCGHTSQKSGEVKVVPGAVCVDTYAHGGGWLTCLDAPTGKFWQVNQLGKKRDGRIEYKED